MNRKRRDILARRKPKRPTSKVKKSWWDVVWVSPLLGGVDELVKNIQALEEAIFSAMGVPASVFKGER